MNTDDVSCYAYIFAPKYAVTNAFEINCWKMIKIMSLEYGYAWYYKHTAFSWGCYGRLPQEEEISPETKSRVIFFLSVVIYVTPSTKGSMIYIILNALRRVVLSRVVLWKVVLRRVVLRDVVYPCNTTLCFGGRG